MTIFYIILTGGGKNEKLCNRKIIKELREKDQLTQIELANIINVCDKTISKWETGKGLPDITLIVSLSKALKVSVIELMNGEYIMNQNKSSNMLKSKFSICLIYSKYRS